MNNEHAHTVDSKASPQAEKVTFGFWVYLMSDVVLFAGLFATYAVLQGATFGGATIYDITNLPFVLIETLLLLTSSFTMGIAIILSGQHKKMLTLIVLAVTLLLGLAFLGMEVYEFNHLIAEGNGPDKSAFLSAFFTLLGTHGLHILFGSIWMLALMAHIALKGFSDSTMRKLMCLSLFWHFLDIIWIFIFTFVYLIGALAL